MSEVKRRIIIFGIKYARKHPQKPLNSITRKEVIKQWLASLKEQTQYLWKYQ